VNPDKKAKKVKAERCVVCGKKIRTMAFLGTGVCGENHRKQREHEAASNPGMPG
jgi:hypothetical protein